MVTILPQFDPGAQIGQNLGSGFGNALNLLGQRQFQQSAIDQLQKNIDSKFYESVPGANGQMVRQQRQDIDPLQMLTELYKGTAGIPGLPQSITETLGPLLINRARGQAYIGGSGRPGSAAPQQAQSAGQSGPQAQQMSTSAIEGSTQGTPSQLPSDVRPSRYAMPDREEFLQTEGRRIIEGGGTPADVETALGNAQKAVEVKRNLEMQQNAFLKDKSGSWQREKGIISGDGEPSQFYDDLAYKKFDSLRNVNPNLADEQLWSIVKQDLNKFHDAEVAIANVSPAAFYELDKRKGQIKSLTDSVRNTVSQFGNTPEVRDRFISDLTRSGWEEDFARAIVNKPSDKLNQWFSQTKNVPLTSGSRLARTALSPLNAILTQEPGTELDPLIADQGLPSVAPNDDILLLRNRLITERQWPVQTANDLIRRLNAEGKLSEVQKSQFPQIESEEKTPVPGVPYLIDIFSPEQQKQKTTSGEKSKGTSWLPSFFAA